MMNVEAMNWAQIAGFVFVLVGLTLMAVGGLLR